MFENVISIEIEFLSTNPSLYFKYQSQKWNGVLPYLYKVELFYLWPCQTGLYTHYEHYSQRKLVLAITQKLLDHSVWLEDYEISSDFLEKSDMKENAEWDVSNTLNQVTVLCLWMAIKFIVLKYLDWHLPILQ